MKVLRNPRYAKRWSEFQRSVIDRIDHFKLLRFDREGRYSVPVFKAVDATGQGFAFRNIPWQTAYYAGLEDGPRVVPERGQ